MWYDINHIGTKFINHLDPNIETVEVFMEGRLIFFTYWNMIILVLYFFIAFLNDLIGSNAEIPHPKKPLVRKLRDISFASLAFPCSIFVMNVFWIVYTIDRELIFPEKLDDFVPSWLNHCFHTLITIIVFLEMIASYHEYPRFLTGLGVMTMLGLCYTVCFYYVLFNYGAAIYPFFELMSAAVQVLLVIFIILFGLSFYVLGRFLNKKIWDSKIKRISMKMQ
jgi:hypothetical protein